jgi:hypothetical protein
MKKHITHTWLIPSRFASSSVQIKNRKPPDLDVSVDAGYRGLSRERYRSPCVEGKGQIFDLYVVISILPAVSYVESYAPHTANPVDSPLTPFLRLLPASKLAVITILELMRLHGTGGVAEGMKTSRALVSVGKAVEGECRAVWGKKRRRAYAASKVSSKSGDGAEGKAEGEAEVQAEAEPPAAKTKAEAKARGKAKPEAKEGEVEVKKKKVVLSGEAMVAPMEELAAPGESGIEVPEGLTDLVPGMPEWTQVVRVRLGSFLVDRLMASAFVTRQGEDKEGNSQ